MSSPAKPASAFLALLALALAAGAQSPSPPQLLLRALNARGGAARFAAIRTMTVTGTLALPQGNAALLVRTAAPDLFRMELHLPQGLLVQAYDGQHAWQIDPGQKTAHRLTGPAATQVIDEALGFVDMAAWPERNGAQVAYAGKGKLRGRSYLALRFTLRTGSQFVRFLDPATGLGFAEQYPTPHGPGLELIGPYQRVAGLLFPRRFVNDPDSAHPTVLTWNRVELNTPLAPALFEPPAAPAPARVRIDAIYPKGEVFAVTTNATDTLTVCGAAPKAFAPSSQRQTGTIRVWLAGMDGKYRISGSKGAVTVASRQIGDAMSKCGRPLPSSEAQPQPDQHRGSQAARGLGWQREGGSSMRWLCHSYRVTDIRTAGNGHVLVTFAFQVQGEHLHPPASLAGWTPTFTGRGQMVWDCTAHEKYSAAYQISYTATRGSDRIRELVTNGEQMRRLP